jgi:shikimate dehydrogenase
MSYISGRTRVIGIIGDPVAHSRSPAMHNAALEALQLDAVYVPFHVTPARLRDAIRAFRALDLCGLNVTVPHKEKILGMLDGVTKRARVIGAVNTVYRHGDEIFGDNTDASGFLAALREAAVRLRGRRALVIGAGGAARAVVAALHDAGASHIVVANRSAGRRRSLAAHFAAWHVSIETADLEALTDRRLLARVSLVVNTTSLGWHDEPFPPLAYAATPSGCICHDLVYGRRTEFVAMAEQAGRRTLDGLGMLLHQGAAAFTLWTGERPPLEVMRRALEERPAARRPVRRRSKS